MNYRPHTAYVENPARVQETPSRKVTNLQYAAAIEVRCQITPAELRDLERFGVFELELPHLLMAKIEDAGSLEIQSRVTCNDRVFTIVTPVKRWDALLGVNSCGVIMQESVATATEVNA